MSRRLITFALLSIILLTSAGIDASGKRRFKSPDQYRIGTFNLWRSDLGKGDYAWTERKEILAGAIIENSFDIFAAEEVDTTMFRELPPVVTAKGGEYTWLTFSPYDANGEGSMKAQAIVYRTNRFEVLEFHHFWCSETPDVMSTGWDEQKFKRGACCAVLKDIKSGRKLFVMASHFPLGKEARLHFAPIVIEKARLYNPEGYPSFLIGDLNTREDRPESKILRSYWNDSYLSSQSKEGPEGTFNNHGINEDMESAPRIDFVYWQGKGVIPIRYVCNPARYGEKNIYASDHCPVYVDFEIK